MIEMIGKFEELALAALIKAGPDANAAKVYEVMEQTMTKPPAFAALYTALDRMATKKLVSERKDENDSRPKRLFTITGEGLRQFNEAISATRAIEAFGPKGGFHVA